MAVRCSLSVSESVTDTQRYSARTPAHAVIQDDVIMRPAHYQSISQSISQSTFTHNSLITTVVKLLQRRRRSLSIWTPCNTRFLVPIRVQISNGILIGSAVYAPLGAAVFVIYNGPPFPPQTAPSHAGIWTPSNA